MRKALLVAAVFAFGATAGWAARGRPSPPAAPQPAAEPPRILIDRPADDTPSGRRIVVLSVLRTYPQEWHGGPVLTPDVWVVDTPAGRYVAGPVRD